MINLSVIVPVYNGEQYLRRCVDSILTQKYKDFEVILVDDGSTDNSLEICRDYEGRDNRVVVLHKRNAGLVAARKSGLSIARGAYVGYIDCDDYIDDRMYSELMEAAQRDNADMAIGGIIIDSLHTSTAVYNMFPEGFYDQKRLEREIIPKMLIHSGFVRYGIIPGVVVKVFKRELLYKVLPGIPDTINIGEDVAITSHSILSANSVSIVHSAAYHYVQIEESMIHRFDDKRFDKICNLYACLEKIQNDAYRKQLDLYMSFLIFIAVAECIKKGKGTGKEIADRIGRMLNHKLSGKVLHNADISNLGVKDRLKVLLMRHKMVHILMLLIRETEKYGKN